MKVLFALLVVLLSAVLVLGGNIPVNSTKYSASSTDAPVLTIRDVQELQKVSGASVSVDGRYAVYSVKQWSSKTGKSTSVLELLEIQSGKIIRFKEGSNDFSPKFTPDGQFILFLSTSRGSANSPQLYSVPVNGDESQIARLTDYDVPIESYKISKSVNNGVFYIAFSAKVYTSCKNRNELLSCSKQLNDEWENKGSNTGYVYTKLFVRHWDYYITEGKVSHVLLQKVKVGSSLSLIDQPWDTMFGMDSDSPIPPFGGEEQYDISKTGRYVAINLEINSHRVAWTTGWKIYVADVYGYNTQSGPISTSELKKITGFTEARTQNPTFSPFQDEVLAYLAMTKPGHESDNLHVNMYNILTDRTNQSIQSQSLDRSIGDIVWFDASHLIIGYSNDGANVLSLLDISTGFNGTVTPITNEGHSGSVVVVSPGVSAIFSFDSYIKPSELCLLKRSGSNHFGMAYLTDHNPHLAVFNLAKPEKQYFIGALGERVQAWVFKPTNFNSGKKYKVANLIHGGPESSFTDSWSYRWNPQLFASQGYAVIMINFHGSDGFGLKFKESILGNWGSYPYEDITKGTDFLISTNSFMDGNSMCALGASFGGFSVNWLLGHNENNRFKCFVTHDGLSELVSSYYSTDELWFPEAEYQGTPFTNSEHYQKFNPINHVTKWKTPTLVIHGGKDFRLPIAQGLTVFTALQRQGVPSKMIVFPEENHWVLKPQNSMLWYDTVLDWLATWLGQ
ncbi:predicted protein [Naegleria gruberi]|uniref:Predicted protein n=1 Tax=Naegleria gruberi TaxID=5762 RepID=D2W3I0_NAEGR|nr:uncharacterized protein NAEGRDRAFT_60012 [Naegleria gruberi]EFC36427.1 predicted protein [Naegleria gruberi]|eukprot:XP_002669171.1 predicted protein [Naegleria gruberi strain NEG-M]